jgi:hypothetical protein
LSGWKIDYNGDAEFANIHARGRIDTAVFQYDQISAVAGSILVTPEAGVLAAAYTTAGTLTIEGAGFAFTDGSVVRIRAKDSLGAVQQVWVTVTRTGTDNVYTTVLGSGDNKTWPVGTAALGYGTGGGSLMMTAASALDGPRYSVLTHSTSPWTDEVEVGRFGFLDNWQTYAGVDYGIAIGDYAGGNYLLYGTTTGFEMHAGDDNLVLDDSGLALVTSDAFNEQQTVRWMDGATRRGYVYVHEGATGGESIMVLQVENGTNYDRIYANSDLFTISADLAYAGDLKPYRNATTYTGYIFVPLVAYVSILSGAAYDTDNDEVTLDLSVSGIPAGVKAVSLQVTGICATAGKYVRFGPNATYPIAVELREPVANGWVSVGGICPCDANGDIYVTTDAAHGAEFTIYAKVTGYFI